MDGDLRTEAGLIVPESALTWRFSRSTGPGGQGVNTTDSRVELVVDLTALTGPPEAVERVMTKLGDSVRIVARTERSQLRNREEALRRLGERIDAAARPRRTRRPTRPSEGAVQRRLEEKRRRSDVKVKRREPDPEE